MLNRPAYPMGKSEPGRALLPESAFFSYCSFDIYGGWSGKLHAQRNVCRRSAPFLIILQDQTRF